MKKIKWYVFIALTVIVFGAMFFGGKIQYGDMVSIVNSNEYYMNIFPREISDEYNYTQTFSYDGGRLYSITTKYIIDENAADASWQVQLIRDSSGEIVQSWKDSVSQLNGQNVREYILDTPYECEADTFKIVISSLEKGNTGVYLLGSEGNTLLVGELTLNDQVQEGDLSIMYSEIRDVRITLVYGILMAMILAGVICILVFGNVWTKIRHLVRQIGTVVRKEKYNILRTLILFVLVVILAGCIERFWIQHKELPYNWIRHLYWSVAGCSLVVLYSQRKYLKTKPEVVICSILAMVGFLYIFAVPGEAEISWDESIHYWRAVALSHANTGVANYAESYLYWHSGIPYSLPNNMGNLTASYNNIQGIYNTMASTAVDIDSLSNIYIVAYIPAAIFLKMGRVLQFPYWITFKLGLLANFALYLSMVYLAIRKVKSGKMIVTVSATIGTAFFLSTVYSADWWIFGWFMLAMAYFFGVMQGREKITRLEMAVIIISSTIAFFPKAVYFPLLCIFFFIPKEKFRDGMQHLKFISAVIASIGILALGVVFGAIWLIPVWFVLYAIVYPIMKLISKMSKKQIIILVVALVVVMILFCVLVIKYVFPLVLGVGDIRGGSGVNAVAQVQFILEDPIRYAKIFINYLTDYYLVFDISWSGLFNTLGYLGSTKSHVISLILLVVVCVTDKSGTDQWRRYNYVKWAYVFLCFVTLCLVCTALYISFTTVGHDTIIGVQQRYMIPMLYAFCALIGSSKVDNRMNRITYNGLITAACTVILLSNIWVAAISKYL